MRSLSMHPNSSQMLPSPPPFVHPSPPFLVGGKNPIQFENYFSRRVGSQLGEIDLRLRCFLQKVGRIEVFGAPTFAKFWHRALIAAAGWIFLLSVLHSSLRASWKGADLLEENEESFFFGAFFYFNSMVFLAARSAMLTYYIQRDTSLLYATLREPRSAYLRPQ